MQFEQIESVLRLHSKLVGVEDYEFVHQTLSGERRRVRDALSWGDAIETLHWVSLRVLHRKQPGVAIGVVQNEKDLDRLIDRAIFSSQVSTADPWFRFPKWRSNGAPTVTEEEVPIPFLENRRTLPEGVHCIETQERWTVDTKISRKSERQFLSHRGHTATEHLQVFGGENQIDILKAGEKRGSLDPNFFAVFADLSKAPTIEKLEEGPVLLSALAASELIRFVAPWFVAEQDAPIPPESFPSCVTLIDDGRHPEGIINCPFDLEGVLTQRTVIVQNGRLVSKLCDSYQGARLNQLSTGNRFRKGSGLWPSVLATTFFLEKGSQPTLEIFRSLTRGTVIHGFTRVIVSRESRVKVSAMGWRIERAGVLRPFSHTEFEIDLVDAMQQIVAVGDDLEFFGGFGSPSILFERLP